MDTLRKGCFERMDDLPVHTTPNHHPPKMEVFSKLFFIILAIIVNGIQVHPPNSCEDLSAFCLILLLLLY